MRVFISWSGERSKQIAEHLHGWMPRVIQAIDPYISSNDIEKGARWASDLANELDKTRFGVVCLVRENLSAPWIHFEAGALSKSLDTGRVAPILFGMTEADLAGSPLVQFQLTKFVESDVLKLMQAINRSEGAEAVKSEILEDAFQKNWPQFKEAGLNLISQRPLLARKQDPAEERQEKVFEEVMALSREQMKRLIAVEEKLSVLTATDVQRSDTRPTLLFFEALSDLAMASRKSLEVVHGGLSSVAICDQMGLLSDHLKRIDTVKSAIDRLNLAARKIAENGCSGKVIRSILPDMRRAVAFVELW